MQKPAPKSYQPEQINFEKNFLNDLKKKVDTEMDEDMINNLSNDHNEVLQSLILCEPGYE